MPLMRGALLRGFASPALFAIMGLMIIGQGMFQSAALDYPTRLLVKAHGKYPLPVMMLIFVFVMVVSAFLNNTPVVVMFIPIMAAIASQSKVPGVKIHDAAVLRLDLWRDDHSDRLLNQPVGGRCL